jgi:hypothetical protein
MSDEALKTRQRRTARGQAEIKELLEQYEQSGMDAKDFCGKYNIGQSTLQKWKSRYGKKEEAPMAQDGFIPVQISSSAVTGTEGLFAEVKGIKLYQPVAASYLKELLQ